MFIARKVSRRNFRFKKKKGKGKSTSKKGSNQRGGFKPFRKGSSGGKANMANEYQDLYDDESCSTGQAMMAFQLIQADTVSESPMTATAKQSLAILDNGCTRSMGSWRAIQRFTQAIEPIKDLISYSYIPAKTKFTFANGETAKVNWTLRLRYHTTPPCRCSTNIDTLEQGTVPTLLSISQMRKLYMTIEHKPQCDKITCEAFGINHQAVPVSGTGHALVDLAGVAIARVKSYGEIAIKGLTNYVYDDDNSIQFPREHSVSEQVCASKQTEAKEEIATPKRLVLSSRVTGYSTIRARITPFKALFTPTGAKECPVKTEIIDASEGGEPEILEDNWTLTSQANKPLINL